MTVEDKAQPLLADLVDLATQTKHDAETDPVERMRRDRGIGQDLDHLKGQHHKQLSHWLQRVGEPQQLRYGWQAVQAQRLVTMILVILGLIVGWAAALTVFHYDGSRPVNVVHVLAVFVALPLALLAFFVLATLPREFMRLIPGAAGLQETLGLLSPGRINTLIVRMLPQTWRLALQRATGQTQAHRRLYGRVQKWAVFHWSQSFSVAFHLGSLTGCLYLVTFSDLAFGWSTTLQVDAGQFQSITNALSWPWISFWSDAQPTSAQIEITKFFRHEGMPSIAHESQSWWQFLFACMLCYGLLPRFGTYALSRWCLVRGIKDAMIHTPGVPQLLDRINHKWVETSAESADESTSGNRSRTAQAHEVNLVGRHIHVVNWAGIGFDDHAIIELLDHHWGITVREVRQAGGAQELDQDQHVIDELAQAPNDTAAIVLVKAWEPPMMDLVDFLVDLRQAMGNGRPIVVAPIALRKDQLSVPSQTDLDIWRHKLETVGDPWLTLRHLAKELT